MSVSKKICIQWKVDDNLYSPLYPHELDGLSSFSHFPSSPFKMKDSSSFVLCLVNIFTSGGLFWLLAKDCLEPLRALEFGEIDWSMKTLAISLAENAIGTFVFLEFGQHWSFRNSGVVYNTAMILLNSAYFLLYEFWRDSLPVLSFTELIYTLYQYCIKRRQRRKQEQFYLSIHLYRSLLLLPLHLDRVLDLVGLGMLMDAGYIRYIVPITTGVITFFSLAYQQPFLLVGCFLSLLILISDKPRLLMGISSLYSLMLLIAIATGMLIR